MSDFISSEGNGPAVGLEAPPTPAARTDHHHHSHRHHQPDHGDMSESEEMYLVTAAMLTEDGMEGPIPLSALAQARSIMPASVNQMVRKLADSGLVTYFPYKGLELTPAGQSIALRILRYRRLWEVFLVKKLRLAGTAADALACRFEHLTSDEVADRLDQYLGEPQLSPQGKPIPRMSPSDEPGSWLSANQVGVAQKSRVVHVKTDPVTRAFLAGQGIQPGATMTVLAVGSDGACLTEVDGRSVHLSSNIAGGVMVQAIEA